MIARESSHALVHEWTLGEYAAAMDAAPSAANAEHAASFTADDLNMRIKRDGAWFAGLKSVADARALLDTGWRKGADRLASVAEELAPPTARSRKRRVAWSADGDDLNIDRALRGEWDSAWRTSRRVWGSGHSVIDVYAKFGGHSGHDADELFWQGAAAAVIADRLESAGYGVRLVGYFIGKYHNDPRPYRHDVVLKEASDPLRLDAVASVVCHAGTFRTLGFRALFTTSVDIGSGLGYNQAWSDVESVMRLAGEVPEHAIMVDNCFSKSDAIDQIKRALASVGGDS